MCEYVYNGIKLILIPVCNINKFVALTLNISLKGKHIVSNTIKWVLALAYIGLYLYCVSVYQCHPIPPI